MQNIKENFKKIVVSFLLHDFSFLGHDIAMEIKAYFEATNES